MLQPIENLYSLSFDDFNENLEKISSLNSLDAYLQFIFAYSNLAVRSGKWKGHALYIQQVDDLLISLLNHTENQENIVSPDVFADEALIIASEVYTSGGHGKVLNQILEHQNAHVIFTDVFNNITNGLVKIDGLINQKNLSTIILSGPSYQSKLNSIMSLLRSIKPKYLFLLGHHQDVITQMAGIAYASGQRTIFIHHCDHDPAIGASINYGFHLDFTEELSNICSSFQENLLKMPLVVSCPQNNVSKFEGKIRIATCGTSNKYLGVSNNIGYIDLLQNILSTNIDIEFFHIGKLEDDTLNLIIDKLEKIGVNPNRFKAAGQVNSLQKYLYDEHINIFLPPFPMGGGLATMEAQSLGIPVIYANPNIYSLPLTAVRSIFPSTELEWRSLNEVSNLIKFTHENWSRLSKSAYECYEKHSHPRNLVNVLAIINNRYSD
jgi:hypothetical protein